ncbi:MAG: glutamine cyclotransferase [Fimbriimonadales bacterium]
MSATRLLLLCLLATLGGCATSASPQQDVEKPKQAAAPKTDFDGKQAFEMLRKQVEFGPRVPGSDAHAKCLEWMVTTLKQYTPHVEKQPFTGSYKSKTLHMTNVIARFNPDAKKQVVIAAHWDTRPTADEEPRLQFRNKPIDGANDGASGVAVLLELARVFATRPPAVGVQLVFFDGEDLGPSIDNMLLGAKHWSQKLTTSKPDFGILLDMVGDKDLRIPVEAYSYEVAKDIVKKVYGMAERLGMSKTFPFELGTQITDDHVPMNQAGVPTIDLIDFDYPYWHTLEDTLDKVSADSLHKVGTLVEAVLRDER